MREHWSTFIVEDDFQVHIKQWIECFEKSCWVVDGQRSNTPSPYIGGSLQALDNAFLWVQKYGVKVIIDQHAAPASQNGYEHSSSRDGSQEWGKTDQNIQETVAVIDFSTARYAKNPSLYAVELIHEPLAPGASVESLNKHCSDGYKAVRKHSSTTNVLKSLLLYQSGKTKSILNFIDGTQLHYYFKSLIDIYVLEGQWWKEFGSQKPSTSVWEIF